MKLIRALLAEDRELVKPPKCDLVQRGRRMQQMFPWTGRSKVICKAGNEAGWLGMVRFSGPEGVVGGTVMQDAQYFRWSILVI